MDGLKPHSLVTVIATTNNILGLTCSAESMATFVADSNGRVDLDHHEPATGSYSGVDGMGLLWSMEMRHVQFTPVNRNVELVYEPGSTVVHLSVEMDGKVLATEDCIRRLYDSDVQMLNISEQDMVGKLFVRRSGVPAPGINHTTKNEWRYCEGKQPCIHRIVERGLGVCRTLHLVKFVRYDIELKDRINDPE